MYRLRDRRRLAGRGGGPRRSRDKSEDGACDGHAHDQGREREAGARRTRNHPRPSAIGEGTVRFAAAVAVGCLATGCAMTEHGPEPAGERTAVSACDDGTGFSVRFEPKGETATLALADTDPQVVPPLQPSTGQALRRVRRGEAGR